MIGYLWVFVGNCGHFAKISPDHCSELIKALKNEFKLRRSFN